MKNIKMENLTEEERRALENFDLQALARLGLAVPREQPRPQRPQRPEIVPQTQQQQGGPGVVDVARRVPLLPGGGVTVGDWHYYVVWENEAGAYSKHAGIGAPIHMNKRVNTFKIRRAEHIQQVISKIENYS